MAVRIQHIFVVLVAFTSQCQAKSSAVQFIEECQQKNPNQLDHCLLELFRFIKPQFKKGIPELNVPSLDPINMNAIDFQRNDGILDLKAIFKDVIVYGYANSSTDFVKTDWPNRSMKVHSHIPNLMAKGSYTLDGRVVLLPIQGTGAFALDLDDVYAVMTSKIVERPVNGKRTIGIESTVIDLNVGKTNVKLENLFNGNRILGDTVNHFLNENGNTITEQVRNEAAKDIAKLVQQILDTAMQHFPPEMFHEYNHF